jgi:hypothetical protein
MTKELHGLETLFDYLSEDIIKNIKLKEYNYSYSETEDYLREPIYLKQTEFWFKHKEDTDRNFYIQFSIVNKDYKEEKRIFITIDLLTDSWMSSDKLIGRTKFLRPLIDYLNECFKQMEKGIDKLLEIRLLYLFSELKITFDNNLENRLMNIEKK